ncbi:MAG: TonB-dependent receptor [Bacteroidota bacterium]
MHRKRPNIPSLIFFCLLCICTWAQAQTAKYTFGQKGVPLEEVILEMEERLGIAFSYKSADIKGKVLYKTIEAETIEGALKQLFAGQGLTYNQVDDTYIILTLEVTPAVNMRELKGVVKDRLTGDPLAFANVYLQDRRAGTTTKKDGSFLLWSSLQTQDSLVISYLGYVKTILPARDFLTNEEAEIFLTYVGLNEQHIDITDYLTDGIDLAENGGAIVIRPRAVGTLPGQVEADIMQTVQFLPGVSAPSGEVSNLYFRGGTPDQNLFLWEEIPVYQTSHYFGMISAFNPYIIDEMKVFKGGFGAPYGNRVSGVVDMRSGDPLQTTPLAGAGFNLTHGYAYTKIPFAQQKAQFIASVRRSHNDFWRTPTFAEYTRRVQRGSIITEDLTGRAQDLRIEDDFQFVDAHAKIGFRPNPQNDIAVAGFITTNQFQDSIFNILSTRRRRDTLRLTNVGSSLKWKHNWGKGWATTLKGVYTDFSYDYNFDIQVDRGNFPEEIGIKSNSIQERQVHLVQHYESKDKFRLEGGYQWTDYKVNYLIDRERNNIKRADEDLRLQSDLHSLYADFKTDPQQKWGLQAGLRTEYFEQTKRWYWQPRLHAWYNFLPEWRLHGQAGQYAQYISQLLEFNGDHIGIEIPIWVLANKERIPVLTSQQYQLGILWNPDSWVLDVQMYHRKLNGLTSLATGFEGINDGDYELGEGSVWGVDFLIKKKWKYGRTWLSYTLSQVNYEFPDFFDPDFPAGHDQRHTIYFVNQVNWRKWEASVGWNYASGLPYAAFDSFKIMKQDMGPDIVSPIYEAYNDHRLPSQHNLNLSAAYKLAPKDATWKGIIGISLYNIYQNENAYSRDSWVELRPGSPPIVRTNNKINLRFTPNAVVRFKW